MQNVTQLPRLKLIFFSIDYFLRTLAFYWDLITWLKDRANCARMALFIELLRQMMAIYQ